MNATTNAQLDRLARRFRAAEALQTMQPARYRSRLDAIMLEAERAEISFEQIAARADEQNAAAATVVVVVPKHRAGMQLIAYRHKGSELVHFAKRSASESAHFIEQLDTMGCELLAQTAYPLNWSELGSSAKDLWEERQQAAIRRDAVR